MMVLFTKRVLTVSAATVLILIMILCFGFYRKSAVVKNQQSFDSSTETAALTSSETVDEKVVQLETEKDVKIQTDIPVENSTAESSTSESSTSESSTVEKNLSNDGTRVDRQVESGNGEINLKDRIICIDPGHQKRANYDKEPVAPGSDELKDKCSSGATGIKTKIPEYRLNLEVSLKLKDALEKQGAKVIMTRTENDFDMGNADRAEIANNANAGLYIRIHADGSTNSSINGVSVLIPGSGHIKDKVLLEESAAAGRVILKNFVKATGAKSRGVTERNDLTGFNWCKVPMLLIEMGFLSNAREDELLNSEVYQEHMIEGIVHGIDEYFKST